MRSFATLGGSNTGAWVKRYVQSSGNTGNCGTFYCGVRPCFYVSEKYFKGKTGLQSTAITSQLL
ncbi:MAG: hypothetical protein L6V93_08350 [Clostridiales bacterium]|nr:MAG: hypothetical protein L6V93_08350 [Clostridiales bacterium]